MKKLLALLALGFNLLVAPAAFAQFQQPGVLPPTVLPSQNENIGGEKGECVGMADMIRSGNIHLNNLPCFIKYFAQTLIAIGGTIAVIFVMIGGYTYVMGGDEGQDKGKKIVTHALMGLAISLLAWIIVDIVLQVATE